MMSNQIGRVVLYTDVEEITYENVIDVVRKAFNDYRPTIDRINFLLDFDAGNQPLQREKEYRKDINVEVSDNVVNEATEFSLAYKWGNPITFVQRGTKSKKKMDAISMLNECYELQAIKSKTQQLGRFVEIGAIGYTYVEPNKEWKPDDYGFDDEEQSDNESNYPYTDSPFKIETLEPQYAFIIRSSYYIDRRKMLGVSFRTDSEGNKHFTCFSKDRRYEILNLQEIVNGEEIPEEKQWQHKVRSGEINPLGLIPIVEWQRSFDRLGLWERQIDEQNNLNLLISDFSNDIDQNTQAIWHCNDVEFPEETIVDEEGNEITRVRKPKTNEFLQTFTTQDGKTPFVNPLAVQYDYNGMLENIITRRALILQKCNVPQRNDNSGGSTGVAMSDATGWSAAEMAATKQQNIMEACKMEEASVVLAAIRNCPGFPIDNPMMKLKISDMQANSKRQKTYELTVKTNAIATLIGKGFALEDALNIAPLFEDPNQVVVRSGAGVRAYQDANVFNITNTSAQTEESRPFPDYSDQESNSPNIGGMEMNQQTE